MAGSPERARPHAVAAALALALTAVPTAAQDVPAARWYDAITLDGLLSSSYSYNFNHPKSGTNQYRVFDLDDDSLRVDELELVLQESVANAGDVGFRADLVAGSSIPRVSAAAGLFRDADGTAGDFDLQQGYLSVLVGLGRGLRIDIGKYCTSMGYEVIEGYDGFNDNATRSFLFGYALPGTHTGVRLTYPLSKTMSAQLHVVNGWDNARDNNHAKSIGAQVAFTPGRLGLYLNAMAGPEKAGNTADRRDTLDLIATFKAAGGVTLGLNVDGGREERSAPDGGTARWDGAAAYVRLAVTRRFAVGVRAEHFRDRDGIRTGTAQTLTEVTLTPEWRAGANLVVRGDLRHDRSDRAVFEKADSSLRQGQTTVGVNVLVLF